MAISGSVSLQLNRRSIIGARFHIDAQRGGMGRVLGKFVRLTLANALERPSTPAPWIYTKALLDHTSTGTSHACLKGRRRVDWMNKLPQCILGRSIEGQSKHHEWCVMPFSEVF